MSEQAKLTYLQERLKEARSHERSGFIVFIIGLVFAAIGFAFYPASGTIYMIVAGVLMAILGSVEYIYYTYQRVKLMEQLKEMAVVTPKCPKCGKELPQGNFMFCPFCGSPLERK